jgi:cysteine desulfurase
MVSWLEGAGPPPADPGRVHAEGRAARFALEQAREQVAGFLGTRPRQVVFTSGATESVNAAVWAATQAHPGMPVASAGVEHSSVRQASERLAPVVTLPVDGLGRILPDAVEAALGRAEVAETPFALVHCQAANHEVGTIQPVEEIVAICRSHGILVHVDAASAAGHMELDLDQLGADLVSVSAHKLGGPPGIGALVVRRGLRFSPLIVGGDQERARRAGLENLPAAIGFGAAAETLCEAGRMATESQLARTLTDKMIAAATRCDGVNLLGDPAGRIPHIVALGIEGVEAEPVLLALDRAGIAAHSGSSCASESLAPSPVLEAMGVDADRSLRLSVGWSSADEDAEAFGPAFERAVHELRSLRT